MLKSPEEYLSNLSFAPPEQGDHKLTPGERVFIEKYLGLDAFERLPELVPEETPVLLPVKTLPPPKQIVIAPEAQMEEPAPAAMKIAQEPQEQIKSAPVTAKPATAPVKIAEKQAQPAIVSADIAEEKKPPPKAAKSLPTRPQTVTKTPQAAPVATKKMSSAPQRLSPAEKSAAQALEKTEVRPEYSLPSIRELLKEESEIQMVSFFISGQIFLLPVIAIQEVLRHQELIKIPRAPDFVAGVINLRGRVTPLIYLSALLTNNQKHVYSEKNFIIICGTQQLQIGLIIDRINSMHLLPQAGIIWNAEAKLGDAAEFLCAIATLDDKVCGIVAPETIAQKIIAS